MFLLLRSNTNAASFICVVCSFQRCPISLVPVSCLWWLWQIHEVHAQKEQPKRIVTFPCLQVLSCCFCFYPCGNKHFFQGASFFVSSRSCFLPGMQLRTFSAYEQGSERSPVDSCFCAASCSPALLLLLLPTVSWLLPATPTTQSCDLRSKPSQPILALQDNNRQVFHKLSRRSIE